MASYRARDVELGVLPPPHVTARVAAAVAAREPFRFMMTGVHVTDDALVPVHGTYASRADTWFVDEPYAAAAEETEEADAETDAVRPCSVLLFGRHEEGPSVCVRVTGFRPWFRVEVPDAWRAVDVTRFLTALNTRALRLSPEAVAAGHGATAERAELKRYYGWVPDPDKPWRTRRFAYLKLSLPTVALAQRAARFLAANAVNTSGAVVFFTKLPQDAALLAEMTNVSDAAAAAALGGRAMSGQRRESLLKAWLARHGHLQLTVADTLQKPSTKLVNDLGLGFSEWVTVASYGAAIADADSRISNCAIEVGVPAASATYLWPSLSDVTLAPDGALVPSPALLAAAAALPAPLPRHPLLLSRAVALSGSAHKALPIDKLAPLVVASFDCEMYSHDDTFPAVAKGDSTKYIGTNFRVVGRDAPTVRVMQCVGDVVRAADAAVDVHVECYPTERALYEAWRDLIVSMDPDIVLSWNGYGFDFPFMHADYTACFAGVEERCTEGMQHAMRVRARAMLAEAGAPPAAPEQFETAPQLLARLARLAPRKVHDEMVERLRKAHGGKFAQDLLAAEKMAAALLAKAHGGDSSILKLARGGAGAAAEEDGEDVAALVIAAAAGALPTVDEEEEEDDDGSGSSSSDSDSSDSQDGDSQDDDEDDDVDAPRFALHDDVHTAALVHLSPLAEGAAAAAREELRAAVRQVAASGVSAAAAAARALPHRESVRSLPLLMRDMAACGVLPRFLEWVASQHSLGPGVARLLTLEVPHADAVPRGFYLSRIAAQVSALVEKRMNSAAKGQNVYNYYDMQRVCVDLMQIIKDDKKPEDNSLRYAAERWLGAAKKPESAAIGGVKIKVGGSGAAAVSGTKRAREGGEDGGDEPSRKRGSGSVEKGDKGDKGTAKLDLSATDMFKLYRRGARNPVLRWPIVEYCARDCDIPLMLVETLKYVTVWVEMSRVCFTPLDAVVNAGQQVKVFNLISRFVHGEFAVNVRDSGWPVNDYGDDATDDDTRNRVADYQGATVIEPKKGFYTFPISTLDFASLYPSIIRFYNLCPSVLDIDDVYKTLAHDARVTFESHAINHNVLTGWAPVHGTKRRKPLYKAETRTYTFATHVQGVLPRLLKHLAACRKAAKKLMEAAETRAAEAKAMVAFLHGITLSGTAAAAEADALTATLVAAGKPKAAQLRNFKLGRSAGSCTREGLDAVRATLLANAAAARAVVAGGATDSKLAGVCAECDAFCRALDALRDAPDLSAAVTAAMAGAKAAAAAADLDAAVQNGRQLGIKVSMNSVYGFNGVSADKGLLPCKPVAAVTTLKGRAFIGVAKNHVERTYPGAVVVYGDTDSVMIMWGRDISVEEAYRLGGEAAAAITRTLREGGVDGLGGAGYEARVAAASGGGSGGKEDEDGGSPARDLAEACKAVDLTNEKVYRPFLLDDKKRYAGLCWKFLEELGEFKAEVDMKGLQAVRRDSPPFVRKTFKAILDELLYRCDVGAARAVLAACLDDIVCERLALEAFIMSKSVKGSYKGGVENLPQVQAWRRMQARGDDDIPPIGARMPYLVTAPRDGSDGGAGSDVKLHERAEHPAHVRATGQRLDLVYYVQQLQKPVIKLVQHVNMPSVKALFDASADRASARMKCIHDLSNFMGAGGAGGADSFLDWGDEDEEATLVTATTKPAIKTAAKPLAIKTAATAKTTPAAKPAPAAKTAPAAPKPKTAAPTKKPVEAVKSKSLLDMLR